MGIFTLREVLAWIGAMGPGVELLAARASLYGVEGTRGSARTLLATLTVEELARPALLRTARTTRGGAVSDISDPLGWIYVLPSGETDDIDELADSVGSPAFFIVLAEADPDEIVQETVQAFAQTLAILPSLRETERDARKDR